MTNQNDVASQNDLNPGVFNLPVSESATANSEHPQGSGRKGAVVADWENADQQVSEHLAVHQSGQHDNSDDDFPMVVWLRGDEPWFTQFDMDADTVMNALGIKRSRLTQIAGRDLRVGRVRIDRYIRPVFRSIDVEHYLNLTRATATHQKSSDAIKQAAIELRSQSHRFESTLETINANLLAHLNSVIGTKVTEAIDHAVASLRLRLDALESDLTNRISISVRESLTKQIDLLTDKVSLSFSETSSKIEETNGNINRTIHEAINGAVERIRDSIATDLQLQNRELAAKVSETTVSIAKTEQRVAAMETSLHHHLKAISADLAQLKKPEIFKKKSAKALNDDATAAGTHRNTRLSMRAAPHRRRRHKG